MQRTKKSRLVLLCSTLAVSLLSLLPYQAQAQTGLGLRLGQPDGLRLGIDGRLTLDAAAYLPADRNNFRYSEEPMALRPESADRLRMPAGTSITQARIAMLVGYHNWSGRLDINFAGQRVRFADITAGYDFNDHTNITLGYQLEPLSIGSNTATRHNSINSPMSVDFLTQGSRHWGVMATHWRDHYWLSGGVYAGGMERSSTTLRNHNGEGYGVSARAVWRPWASEKRTLHLGASTTLRATDRSVSPEGYIDFAVTPGTSVDGRTFLSGDILGAKSYQIYGVEAAYRDDLFYAQAEYINTTYRYRQGTPEVSGRTTHQGGYFTGSVMLRGKQRTYSKGGAVFGNVNPEIVPGGNLELQTLVGYTDGGSAGKALQAVGGINWYPNQLMMLGLSYTYTAMDQHSTDGGRLISLTPEKGLNLHTLQLRAQFVF